MHLPYFMRLPPFPVSPESAPAPDADASPDALVVLARGSRRELGNLALLLASLNIGYILRPRSGLLMVAAKDLNLARREWQVYAEENANWPEAPPAPAPLYGDTPATLLAMTALALFYAHTGPWTDRNPWFLQGAADSESITVLGQWWRLVTAQTLHADASHLLGNVLVGGLVLHLLCKRTGYGAGWLLTILAATCANACNSVLRPTPHLSVGFSTAVFAAIGLLSGMQEYRSRWLALRILVPAGAGLGLLAMLGSEGLRTDLGAHLFGFACGLGLGLCYRFPCLHTLFDCKAFQHLAFTLAVALVLTSWLAAWDFSGLFH